MKKILYQKNIKKFWEKRNQARMALDQERANAPYQVKIAITEKLRKDALLLKTAKRISGDP